MVPVITRRGIARVLPSDLRLRRLFAQHRFGAGDVTADFTHARSLFQLAGGLLEAQVELLLLHAADFFLELLGASGAVVAQFFLDLTELHQRPSIRATMRVLIGSLPAPRRRDSRATASGTPST